MVRTTIETMDAAKSHIHSFNKYLFNSYYVPGMVLRDGDTTVEKHNPYPHGT